ncbi:MAG: hypothetical protein U1D41_14595 [Nitrosomonas sp.]|uniref:hypothetical protein n=1 Tax=Nitrosomonas sp. TaxID=42353 RepID=UPI00277A28E9|nr:hypothetical protein [Nitrosomonas sp.]MDP3609453.1 hypothetical protein [Methylophilus sp.]MDZ4107356.1 hypothetical protein [Nitrosomonas sp.]
MKTSQLINLAPSIRIIKEATCPSLSGKSTLTYHIGCNSESDILLRVVDNTGGGFFSKEWVPLNAIFQAFDKKAVDKPIVSLLLYPLFQGKSLNTPAFLLAVLKQEGLVSPLEDNPKHYERLPSEAFMAEIGKLIESKVDLKTDDAKPVVTTKKSASKK